MESVFSSFPSIGQYAISLHRSRKNVEQTPGINRGSQGLPKLGRGYSPSEPMSSAMGRTLASLPTTTSTAAPTPEEIRAT